MIYLLAIYIVVLIIFCLYSALGLYHLWRYGYIGDLTKPAIVVYILISAVLIITSFIVIAFRPWPAGFNF